MTNISDATNMLKILRLIRLLKLFRMAKLAKAAGFKYLIYTTVWNPAANTFGNYTTKMPRCRPPHHRQQLR